MGPDPDYKWWNSDMSKHPALSAKVFSQLGATPHLIALTMLAGLNKLVPTSVLLEFVGDLLSSVLETMWTIVFFNLLFVPQELAAFFSAVILAIRLSWQAAKRAPGSRQYVASIVAWRGAIVVWGFIGIFAVAGSGVEQGYEIFGAFIAQNRAMEIIFVILIGGVFLALFGGWLGPLSNREGSFLFALRGIGLAYAEVAVLLAFDQVIVWFGPASSGASV